MARSNVEARYCAMAHGVRELLWLRNWLIELAIKVSLQMKLYCDNMVVIHIASNFECHEHVRGRPSCGNE